VRKQKPLPSYSELSGRYIYDHETGALTFRVMLPGVWKKTAGTPSSSGYLVVSMSGRRFAAHRVAWKLFYGDDPAGDIDHINRDKLDNRISNLRIATDQQNAANRLHHKNNRSGFKGVRYEGLNYSARIMHQGKAVHIGMFPTPEAAHAAYAAKARELFGEFAARGEVAT
jgi:hypothetical protein